MTNTVHSRRINATIRARREILRLTKQENPSKWAQWVKQAAQQGEDIENELTNYLNERGSHAIY